MFRKKQGTGTHSGSIDIKFMNEELKDCPDIIRKKVYIEGRHEGFFLYIEGLVDQDLLQRDMISAIIDMSLEELSNEQNIHNIPCAKISILYDSREVINNIMYGESVFICTALPFAVSCMLTDIEKRNIEEPVTEKNVRGPHEGFVEPLYINISILRRKITNSKLKFKEFTLGTQTKQTIAVAYIEGVANMTIVNGLFEKIRNIHIDGLTNIGGIEQIIASNKNSVFPQFLASERPDKAMAALLEGRVVILQEGTPVTLIAPVNFFSFFQSLDDYSTNWIHGSFMRMIRLLGLALAIMLPSLYIALTTFHYYAVPLSLLVPIAESRAKVPFPPIIEVLILEVTIEMVREAAVRLPTYIGTAISVVAGLIIGDAAVRAGIVSGLLIVIVAATAIASYVIPSYDMAMAVRILRFAFMLAAATFGIIGIVVATALSIAHLITLESLGQPFFEPISPFSRSDFKDTFIRFPIRKLKTRPDIPKPQNKIRSGSNESK